jgi:hypothetical protein
MSRKQKVARIKDKVGERGWFLISAIVMILFLTSIGFSTGELVAEQYQHTTREMFEQNAQLVAEAGLEQTVAQLNSDDTFAGYTTTQTYFSNSAQGKGTFTTTVTTNADGTSKTVVSTGLVYHSPGASTPFLTRKVRATVVGTASTGYSVATGPGGLIMSGSSSITNSSVAVSGTITMNGSGSIGTQANPVTVDAGNIHCPTSYPPGATYPVLCTDGTQPITFNNNNARIYGTVCATGQTSVGPNNNIQTGNGGLGLKPGCTAPTIAQPTYDRTSLTSGMTPQSGTNGTYACSGNKTISFPANTKLTGSSVSWANSCNLTLNGNIYIPGDLTIDGSVQITVANSLGNTRPVVVVDGTITVKGSASMIANSSGSGIDFVSFANCIAGTNNACKNGGSNPNQTPTGTDLYNSQQQINVLVGGSANTTGMIFDAYWSEVELTGSGHIGAAAGQTVWLNGAGTVIFGTTLTSGSKTWAITSYQPIFN